MFLVRWAAIALLLLEAAAAALYSFLLASVAAAYWQVELTSRQASAQLHLSWLDVLTQSALLIAVVVIYVVVAGRDRGGCGTEALLVDVGGRRLPARLGVLADARDRWPVLGRQPGRNRRRRPLPRPRARAASTPPPTR